MPPHTSSPFVSSTRYTRYAYSSDTNASSLSSTTVIVVVVVVVVVSGGSDGGGGDGDGCICGGGNGGGGGGGWAVEAGNVDTLDVCGGPVSVLDLCVKCSICSPGAIATHVHVTLRHDVT